MEKKEQEIKAKTINFNEDYNIIKIYKNKIIEFYLEKIGCGNLYFVVGVYEDMDLSKGYIYQSIGIAELSKFWGE